MKALILLGGLGTRLRPFTLDKPKPMLPILNKPFISYHLQILKKFSVREVIFALGYRAAHFKKHLGTGKSWGMKFIYSQEKEPLGTGGAIRKAYKHIQGPTFIFNGDAFCDIDLKKILRMKKEKKANGVIALVPVKNPSAYGLVETKPNHKISRFIEKPSPGETTVNTINAGFYLFDPQIIERIPPNQPVSIEREIFPSLLKEGYSIYGYLHKGYWSDIGTLKSYWNTHMYLLQSDQKHIDARVQRKGLWIQKSARVHSSVTVNGNVLLGPGVSVGKGVIFQGNVCIGAGCRIQDNVQITNSVILEETEIQPNSKIENALIGERCVVESHCRLGPQFVLGNASRMKSHSQQVDGFRPYSINV